MTRVLSSVAGKGRSRAAPRSNRLRPASRGSPSEMWFCAWSRIAVIRALAVGVLRSRISNQQDRANLQNWSRWLGIGRLNRQPVMLQMMTESARRVDLTGCTRRPQCPSSFCRRELCPLCEAEGTSTQDRELTPTEVYTAYGRSVYHQRSTDSLRPSRSRALPPASQPASLGFWPVTRGRSPRPAPLERPGRCHGLAQGRPLRKALGGA